MHPESTAERLARLERRRAHLSRTLKTYERADRDAPGRVLDEIDDVAAQIKSLKAGAVA